MFILNHIIQGMPLSKMHLFYLYIEHVLQEEGSGGNETPLTFGCVKTLHRAEDASSFRRVVSESYNPVSVLSFSLLPPSCIFTPIVLLQKIHGARLDLHCIVR